MMKSTAEILTALTSPDTHQVWLAVHKVIRCRDRVWLRGFASNVDIAKRANKDVDLGGALRPNQAAFDFAMRKLEFAAANSGCMCQLNTEYDLIDPRKEVIDGTLIIHSETMEDGVPIFKCECSLCKSSFVAEQFDYHYAWWKWRRVG